MRVLVKASARAIKSVADGASPDAKAKIQRLVARFVRQLPLDTKVGAKSVIITGYPRSGKSLLAGTLVRSHGYTHVRLDMLTRLYWNIEDDTLRDHTRRAILNALIKRFPKGLVIEGDDLISLNRSSRCMLPFSLATLKDLQRQRQLCCYVVGSAHATEEAKSEGFRRFRRTGECWTSRHKGWNDLGARARDYLSYNREIYALAKRANIPFIEIDPLQFDASLSKAAREISAKASE